jgi:hypothetical protein
MYGSLGSMWPILDRFSFQSRMTAIITLFTKHGFIIGADGRSEWDRELPTDERTLAEESDREQKIFECSYNGQKIAYALAGAVYSRGKKFNAVAEASRISGLLGTIGHSAPANYVERFGRELADAYNKARSSGLVDTNEPYPVDRDDPSGVARLFFVGYFDSELPSFLVMELHHDHQVIGPPRIFSETPRPKDVRVSGPVSLAKYIFANQDRRLNKYALPTDEHSSLEEAAKSAAGFLRACSDPIARQLDPFCEKVGGHIHIAAITPDGFRWRVPPATLLS